jgi:hypothetical protein
MILVPNPHQTQQVARELSDGALVVIKGPGLNSVLIGVAVVTALLAIPYYGIWFSVIALTMGASAYGEIIRRVSRRPTDEPDPGALGSLLPRSVTKFILCALMAAGTVLPLWLLNAGYHQSPHWDALGRAVATITWIVCPLLMLLFYGRTEEGTPLNFRKFVKLLAKHPVATFLALAVVPFTLVLLELCLALILYMAGNLPFFALDYMPMPVLAERPNEGAIVYGGIPHYHMNDYRTYPISIFHQGYLEGLREGYSFVGAIPASLSLSTRADLNASEAIGLIGPSYLIIRIMFSVAIVTCLLAAFAIQAHWLGSIPSLERRKTG